MMNDLPELAQELVLPKPIESKNSEYFIIK